jgi:hypothetical protein
MDVANRRCDVGDGECRVAADETGQCGPLALIGDGHSIDLRGVDEVLCREVRLRADPGVTECELAGLRLRGVDQLLDRLVRRIRRHDEHLRSRDDLGDRHEILLGVVVHLRVDVLVRGHHGADGKNSV